MPTDNRTDHPADHPTISVPYDTAVGNTQHATNHTTFFRSLRATESSAVTGAIGATDNGSVYPTESATISVPNDTTEKQSITPAITSTYKVSNVAAVLAAGDISIDTTKHTTE